MSEIRNLTRNGETFYPLTHVDAIVSNTGSGIDEEPTPGSDNLVKSGGVSFLVDYNLLNKFGTFNGLTNIWINAQGIANGAGTSYIYPAVEGDVFSFIRGTQDTRVWLLKKYPTIGYSVEAEGGQILIDNTIESITIPSSVKFIYASAVYGGSTDYSPKSVKLNSIDITYNAAANITRLENGVSGLINAWLVSNGETNILQGNGYLYNVKEGDKVYIKSTTNWVRAAFCNNADGVLSIVGSMSQINANSEQTIVAPIGAKYLYVSNVYYNGNVYYGPKELHINGVMPTKLQIFGKKIFVKYTASENKFEVFNRAGESDKFYSYVISLRNDTSEILYQYIWCLTNGRYYILKDDQFVQIISQTIYGAENEFSFKYEGRADFTGGFHGDERIDVDPSTYVKFIVNGSPLDNSMLSNDFAFWVDSFSYIEYSSLHATTEDGETPITGHPIIAYHYKDVSIEETLKIKNIVRFVTGLNITNYFSGLFCVMKNLATTTEVSGELIDTSAGTGAYITPTDRSATRAVFWNAQNNLGAIVNSRVVRQNWNHDFDQHMEIADRGSGFYDTKYYRYLGAFSVLNGQVLETETEVKFLS